MDGDLDVDLADFNVMRNHSRTQGSLSEGDVNGDGKIDLADFRMLKQHFGVAAAFAELAEEEHF